MFRDSMRVLRRARNALSPVLVRGAAGDGASLRVVGESAVFALTGRMPTGWVEFSISIGRAQDLPGRARVFAEAEEGSQTVPLPLRRDGKAETVARLPDVVLGLRLQIDRPGRFEQPVVQVRELAAAEGLARVAAPVLAARLREPWLLPLAVG